MIHVIACFLVPILLLLFLAVVINNDTWPDHS